MQCKNCEAKTSKIPTAGVVKRLTRAQASSRLSSCQSDRAMDASLRLILQMYSVTMNMRVLEFQSFIDF